jgi:hypothetical protein
MSLPRKTEVQLNLFPFMSVLCATMGVLMLFLVVIMSTRALAALVTPPPPPPKPEPVVRGEGPEQTGPIIDKSEYEARRRELQQLAFRLAERQADYLRLQQLHAQLRSQIESKEDELERLEKEAGGRVYTGRALGQKNPVQVVPDRSAAAKITKQAVAVEVKAEGFVIHPEKQQCPLTDLDRADSPFVQFLNKIDRSRNQRYLLLLIHPNGAEAFQQLLKYLREHLGEHKAQSGEQESRIDLGWEPFSTTWLYWQEQQQKANH